MPQQTLGYVEMEWTCQRCGTKNLGLQKTCKACGAAMPVEQQFEKPAEGQLIADKEKLEQAKKGADIHCPFCGARNAGDAKTCVNCGGDLTNGQKREAGQVVGAYAPQTGVKVKCPACGTENTASASHCVSCGRPLGNTPAAVTTPAAPRPAAKTPAWAPIAGVIALLACLLFAGFFAFQLLNTTDTVATVQAVRWLRSVGIEARVSVEKDDWADRIPQDAEVGVCELKPREFLNAPDPNRRSDKVCGTPYTVDEGNGVSRVVQDCQYQVFDNFCEYRVLEWKEVDRLEARGDNLNPTWPQLALIQGQREGSRSEKYEVVFSGDSATYTFEPDAEEFAAFTPGSRWTLKVNGLGAVTDAEAAR
ncbi:MAG: zinc finger protein [Anaerolineales bacterium]